MLWGPECLCACVLGATACSCVCVRGPGVCWLGAPECSYGGDSQQAVQQQGSHVIAEQQRHHSPEQPLQGQEVTSSTPTRSSVVKLGLKFIINPDQIQCS